MFRGILSTIYVELNKGSTIKKLEKVLINHYPNNGFVKILKTNSLISTNDIINTNNCQVCIIDDANTELQLIPIYVRHVFLYSQRDR